MQNFEDFSASCSDVKAKQCVLLQLKMLILFMKDLRLTNKENEKRGYPKTKKIKVLPPF